MVLATNGPAAAEQWTVTPALLGVLVEKMVYRCTSPGPKPSPFMTTTEMQARGKLSGKGMYAWPKESVVTTTDPACHRGS